MKANQVGWNFIAYTSTAFHLDKIRRARSVHSSKKVHEIDNIISHILHWKALRLLNSKVRSEIDYCRRLVQQEEISYVFRISEIDLVKFIVRP